MDAISAEWLERLPAAREWLVTAHNTTNADHTHAPQSAPAGVIARGELHLLAGEGGAGKGRWVTQVALGIAASEQPIGPVPSNANARESSLGVRINHSRGKVLLLLGEDDAIEVQRRVFGAMHEESWSEPAKMAIERRLRWRSFRGEDFRLVTVSRDGSVSPSQSVCQLQDYLEYDSGTDGWSLIVIDPLARFLGAGDENDNAAMHAAAAQIEKLCDAPGRPAVLLVAHTRKPADGKNALTQHDVRGASAVVNAARLVMTLQPFNKTIAESESEIARERKTTDDQPAFANVTLMQVVKNNLSIKATPVPLVFGAHGGLRRVNVSERDERWRPHPTAGKKVLTNKSRKRSSSSQKVSAGDDA